MEDIPRCGKCGRYPIDHRDGECIYPADPAVYRAALELVREGLDLPHAKTVGDDVKRMEILFLRVVDLQIMVGAILDCIDGHQFTLGYCRYCREQLAAHAAAGYHPNHVPIAYGQYDKCAADGCGHRKGSHWEHSEPGGPRTGCGYLGCPCTAYAASIASDEAPTREEADRCGYSDDPYHRCRVCYDYAAGREREHPLRAAAAQDAPAREA